MIIKTPDKFFCDICAKENTERDLLDYQLYRNDAIKVAEFHVCKSCEPENAFFDCKKKQYLIQKIIRKFINPKQESET